MSSINKSSIRMIATVVSNKRVGQYHQILLNVGEMVNTCKPGNFVAIRVGGDNAKMILRRAFAVAPFGQGSKWLCAQAEGAEIDLIAPLGTAFGIPTEPVRALLVGGGYGSAPLFGLAEVLKNRGCRVDMYLGASTGGKIYAPMEGKRSVNVLRIYTEDGSMGERGRVTEPIPGLIADGLVDVIYSCGPMPMLRAISEIVAGSDVVHQCAVEESMACGVGICMTCVLPVNDDDGNVSMKRSCIDGPVMDGAFVAWDLVGKIPEAHA
ncbi:MAG: dihydroorotate dehydrogenase electron transfer subunit [Actinobacteria bacterium]|nr:dihydroorotate dehydrogenase electron transfer subunit [Actinomycetota bacterium]